MKANRDNTNKKEIVKNISIETGLPTSLSLKIVDHIISILVSNVRLEKTYKIKNFGTFTLRRKKKRIGRNPKSKINHEISERNVIVFKPSEDLKKKINGNIRK